MTNASFRKTVITKYQDPDKVFYKIDHATKLELINNNELNIFMLNILNNKFSYKELFNLLKDNLGSYALSRKQYIKNPERAISKAISKLRDIKDNDDFGAGGELGEILLYIFLEYYLQAPKILSKVELKTNNNQYVYNADGVHFYHYKKDDSSYNQLVIGESKLKDKLKDAIDSAFDSIVSSKIKEDCDIDLVNSEIFKETFSVEEAERIKNLIIPSVTEDYETNTYKTKAFGVFVGSDYIIDSSLPLKEQRINTIEQIKNLSKKIAKYININIKKYKLEGYSFYVYFLPFNDIKTDKKNIMKQLLTNDAFKEI